MSSAYLDTSFLYKLYVLEAETSVARTHLHQLQDGAFLSALSDVEIISSMSRKLSVADASIAKRVYARNRLAGLYQEVSITKQVFEGATRIAELYAKQYSLRSLDILHVATALQHRIGTIATFDNNLRSAAQALGLAVLPA